MFYSVFVLGKKGPLARVWLAAHWDKKITKAQILETNIVESVDSILQPKVKLSLRTSSHLLLGIVRIYARKAAYLLQDCQDAAFKIKSAFRPGVVELPDGKTEAAISAITLPDNFDFINDFEMISEPQLHMEPTTSANLRNITLLDDVSSINIDDSFGMNDHHDWSDIGSIGRGSIVIQNSSESGTERNFTLDDPFDRPAIDDGFGGSLHANIMDDDVFGMTRPSQEESNKDENGFFGEPIEDDFAEKKNGDFFNSAISPASNGMDDMGADYSNPASAAPYSGPNSPNMDDDEPFGDIMDHTNAVDNQSIITDDLASSHNDLNGGVEPNTMVLEPIDSQIGGMLERKRKRKKKIGMAIDELKTLSGEEMKAQLSDTSDIITNLDLAPPNKILMNWKKTGLVDKLFSLPQRTIPCKELTDHYTSKLITTRYETASDLNEEDAHLLQQDGSEIDEPSINFNRYQNSTAIGGDQSIRPFADDQIIDFDDPSGPNDIEFAAPKRRAKSPNHSKTKKQKTEDKENHNESSKKVRDSVPRKTNHFEENNHSTTTTGINFDNSHHNISAIGDVRQSNASSMQGPGHQSHTGHDLEHTGHDFDNSSDKDDEEDDGFAYDGNGPMSIEPAEEMLPEETIDQFVERVQTKRSTHLLKRMANQLEENDCIYFSSISRNNNRKMAAQNFYGLLVLKKQMAVELCQDSNVPYGDITVTKGYKYDEQLLAA